MKNAENAREGQKRAAIGTPEAAPAETDSFGDVSLFKKSVKAADTVNQRAAAREMPDPTIVDQVKESGVNLAMKNFIPERGTTVIRTKKEAKRVIGILYGLKDRIHAWDTETVGIDVKIDSPVGHGRILCA